MRSSSRSAKRRFDPAGTLPLAVFALAFAFGVAVRGIPHWIGWLYLAASAASFVAFAVDKSAARAGRERVPEKTLLWLAAFGGWPGALVAMQLVRHKTAKRSFRLRFWAAVAANLALLALAALHRSSP